jgi:hypothetical protein
MLVIWETPGHEAAEQACASHSTSLGSACNDWSPGRIKNATAYESHADRLAGGPE